MSISYVQKGLFVGSLAAVRRPATVYDLGIRSVLRLDPVTDMDWLDDFSVQYLPLEDDFYLTADYIQQATAAIHHLSQQKPALIVQCHDGENLSVGMVMAYLIEYHGMSLPNAFGRMLMRCQSAFPSPTMLGKLVEHYHLPYSLADIQKVDFLENLIKEAQAAISPIQDGIYVGSLAALAQPDSVQQMGIEAVLRLDRTNRAAGHWSEGFAVLDLPIADGESLEPASLQAGTAFIHQQVQAGRKVLVHCQMGVSRAPTLVMAYLIEYQDMSLPEAYRLVSQNRPIINPSPLLIQSLVEHYKLPYDERQLAKPLFLEELL
jgi:protein-tyrosine phosphatase